MDVPPVTAPPAPAAASTRPWRVVVALATLAVVLVAWWMTGDAPRAATPAARHAGSTAAAVPPFVLLDGEAGAMPAAQGAAALQGGKRDDARRAFGQLARGASGPALVRARLGMALASWPAGDDTVALAAVRKLAAGAPRDALVQLQLGVIELAAGDATAGQGDVRRARSLAAAAGTWDVYRHADDLLHPDLAPGYPPAVVGMGDPATPAGRAVAARMLRAIVAGDRPQAARIASSAPARAAAVADPAVAAVVAAAAWSKERPLRQDVALTQAAARLDDAAPVVLQRGVILLWNGDRERGLALIRRVAHGPATRPAARRQRDLAAALLTRLG